MRRAVDWRGRCLALGAIGLLATAACTSAGEGGAASSVPSAHPSTSTTSTIAAPVTTAPVPTAAPPVSVPFVSPIRPDNRPTPVAGDTNGEMPARDLVGVAPNCVADRAAAPSLALLFTTARNAGAPLGARECYRSLSGQVTAQQHATAAGNSACAAPVPTAPTGAPKGTSMHGWGKAADFSYGGETVLFGSPGDRYLNATANRFGWNHPGWARPGGSACPEAWHWEWVGDGGALHASPIRADVVALLASVDGQGYSTITGLGALVHRGDAGDHGSLDGRVLGWVISGGARTPDGRGYWLVGGDGTVYAFGDAGSFGSLPANPPERPVVGMTATADGRGYWLLTTDGRVAPFGDAVAYGSPAPSSGQLARPAVAVAATPDGRGYWVATADGHVFAFGDARAYGTPAGGAGPAVPAPIVAMAPTPDGRGYWLAGSDGSVDAFGDAPSLGSAAGQPLREPVVAVASTPSGRGYWLATADGTIIGFGDARYYGAG